MEPFPWNCTHGATLGHWRWPLALAAAGRREPAATLEPAARSGPAATPGAAVNQRPARGHGHAKASGQAIISMDKNSAKISYGALGMAPWVWVEPCFAFWTKALQA